MWRDLLKQVKEERAEFDELVETILKESLA